jgi:polysaccharide export outer membrane protein
MRPIRLRAVLGMGLALLLASCSSMPTSGPASYDIKDGQKDPESLPYSLVKLTPATIAVLGANSPRIGSVFSDRRPPQEIRFGIGDVVGVTVFEAAAGGLFIPLEAGVRPGNFISLPNQNVDSKGNISVPYAGTIRAAGRTPVEVQRNIVESLQNRAIEPQVVVTLIEQRTSLISVLGDVNNPNRFPATAAGEHILDAITRAGGPKSQGFDTWVMLERANARVTVPFGALVYEPGNNIWIHPNDTVYLYREPQTFVAFGASGQQGQFGFDAWRISLAEGVAKAGGLVDAQAEPAAVFLYRGETKNIAKQLGIDVSKYEDKAIVPVIYQVNFRDPAGYFLGTKLAMRNKDVLFVSNATTVETSKVLQFVRLITATANDPVVAAYNATLLRAAVITGP